VDLKMCRQVDNATLGRWYDVDGIYVPSVSTVAKYGCPVNSYLWDHMLKQAIRSGALDSFKKEKSEALRVGTAVHDNVERLIEGKSINVENDPEVQRGLICFMKFMDAYKPKIQRYEEILFCTDMYQGALKYPFAGRYDATMIIDSELWLIDWKTSLTLDDKRFPIQLSMYKALYDATHDRPIDRLGVVHLKKRYQGAEPSSRTKYLREYQFDMTAVKCALYMFNYFYDHSDKRGKPKLKAELQSNFKLGDMYENL
tara:strand:- start:4044 stop:4811 length:768 start_codon:yes stop_codon:yes gene_type:complete